MEQLSGMSFAFICIDDGESKKAIVEYLVTAEIPFVDVGISVTAIEGLLAGSVRVTTGTAEKHDHLGHRISFAGNDVNDYDKNIQIAELNALSAALAVIKWKKLFGFYHDLEKEHHSVYEVTINKLLNDEVVS